MATDAKLLTIATHAVALRLGAPPQLRCSVPHWARCSERVLTSLCACVRPDVSLPLQHADAPSRARLVTLLRWDAQRPPLEGCAAEIMAWMVLRTEAGRFVPRTLAVNVVLREAFPPEEPALHALLRDMVVRINANNRPNRPDLRPEALALIAFVGA